ncbi:MAG: hemerythrin domain-containing protein [Pseudomonadota bacterium]
MATRKTKGHAMDALKMLREDHERMQALFDKFEQTADQRTERRIVNDALSELKIHRAIEEEIFYPAVRAAIDDDDLMDEAEEEHHVAAALDRRAARHGASPAPIACEPSRRTPKLRRAAW